MSEDSCCDKIGSRARVRCVVKSRLMETRSWISFVVVSVRVLKSFDMLAVPPTLLMRTVRLMSLMLVTRSWMAVDIVSVGAAASAMNVRNWVWGNEADSLDWTADSLVGFRPCKMMLKPLEQSSWANASPMPSLLPVTSAQELLFLLYFSTDPDRT